MKNIKEILAATLLDLTLEESIDDRMCAIGTVIKTPVCYASPTDFYCLLDLIRLAKHIGKGGRFNSSINTDMEHYRFTATINMNVNLLLDQLEWGVSIYSAWLEIRPTIADSLFNLSEPVSVTTPEDWTQVWEALEEHIFLGYPELLTKFRDENKLLPDWEFYNELYNVMDK